jgi:hypothetical protein
MASAYVHDQISRHGSSTEEIGATHQFLHKRTNTHSTIGPELKQAEIEEETKTQTRSETMQEKRRLKMAVASTGWDTARWPTASTQTGKR